jgi:hypothetical protein
LGLDAVQIARLLGTYPIIAIDQRPVQGKRALAAAADSPQRIDIRTPPVPYRQRLPS